MAEPKWPAGVWFAVAEQTLTKLQAASEAHEYRPYSLLMWQALRDFTAAYAKAREARPNDQWFSKPASAIEKAASVLSKQLGVKE
mmetsp:Transcript_42114/g.131887  ORF Transcript_42114/g.131887 Transcript_42114/m.131887 type:complete len:85 (+) Transcript_42114:2695-2949(+)